MLDLSLRKDPRIAGLVKRFKVAAAVAGGSDGDDTDFLSDVNRLIGKLLLSRRTIRSQYRMQYRQPLGNDGVSVKLCVISAPTIVTL
jgi:hypothetical protein